MKQILEKRWLLSLLALSATLGCAHVRSPGRPPSPAVIDLKRAEATAPAEVLALPAPAAVLDTKGSDGLICVPLPSPLPLAEKLTRETGVLWQAQDCTSGGAARRLDLTPMTPPPMICKLSAQQHGAEWAFLERNELALGISSARGELFESPVNDDYFLQRIPGTLIGTGESIHFAYGDTCRLKRISTSLVAGITRIAKRPTVSRKHAQDVARLESALYGVFPPRIQSLTTLAVVDGRLAWVVTLASPGDDDCGYPVSTTLSIDATTGTFISAKKSVFGGCRGAR